MTCPASGRSLNKAHLAERLDSLPESEVDNDPGKEETQAEMPTNLADVMDTLGHVQHEVTEINKGN